MMEFPCAINIFSFFEQELLIIFVTSSFRDVAELKRDGDLKNKATAKPFQVTL